MNNQCLVDGFQNLFRNNYVKDSQYSQKIFRNSMKIMEENNSKSQENIQELQITYWKFQMCCPWEKKKKIHCDHFSHPK